MIATHGATAAYFAALDAFVNPGDRVVLFDPCSPLFAAARALPKSRHAKVRWVPTWTEDGRCRYIAADFERAMRGAKVLVMSDPGSPAGGCLSNEDLEHIAWIAGGYGVLVYLDESFAAFRYQTLTPGEKPRVLAAMPGTETASRSRPARCPQEFGQPGVRVPAGRSPDRGPLRPRVSTCTANSSLQLVRTASVCPARPAARAALPSRPRPDTLSPAFRAKRQYTDGPAPRDGGLEPGTARRRILCVDTGHHARPGRSRVRGTPSQ